MREETMAGLPEKLNTEHLFDAHIDLEPPQAVGESPFGRRSIIVVKGGTFAGPRLRGRVLAGGADWLLTLPGGVSELDVRATFETDDGALIYVSYHGVLDAEPAVLRRIFVDREDVSPAEYYFRTTPRFETGHPTYAWLNKLVTVGAGKAGINQVSYRVFAVR
jgi:hypothetical protein